MNDDWLGSPVADTAGQSCGRLIELFVGKTSGEPEFGIVALGNGEERVAVPLTGALRGPGGTVVLPFAAERVLAAPRMQGEVDEIPAEVGRLIHEQFGMHDAPTAATTPLPPTAATAPLPPTPPAAPLPANDHEDVEVTLSEEQLAVETRAHATERVRVRKHVVTEEVTVTVTLRREELVIEREPVPATSHQAATTDFPLGDDGREVEFVLHAEEPVVTKRVVPVERVRINRNTITEERRIADTVRRERVDVDETPTTQEGLPR
jgi:uncharacterized protein (TIGR02271 family)